MNLSIKNTPYCFALLLAFLLASCAPTQITPNPAVSCELPATDSSASHPDAGAYQALVTQAQASQIPGLVVLAKDDEGLWAGASGWADMTDQIELSPCMPFFIASISKVFTSTVIWRLIDEGTLALDQPVSQWIDADIVAKLENADQSKIRHLLDHTSGIADYITLSFDLQQINSHRNGYTTMDMLSFAYGLPATHEVGTTYYYSNTNFVLLGLIAEAATGQSLAALYDQIIFNPLGLQTGYYGTDEPLPDNVVRGYIDYIGQGDYVDAEWLYRDEMRTGDGGIAINAYDMATFIEALFNGEIISEASLALMTDWFDLPEDWVYDAGNAKHVGNGLGIEVFQSSYGTAFGHSGGIYGFNTLMLYFPEHDATFIYLNNSITVGEVDLETMISGSLDLMFN